VALLTIIQTTEERDRIAIITEVLSQEMKMKIISQGLLLFPLVKRTRKKIPIQAQIGLIKIGLGVQTTTTMMKYYLIMKR